MFIRKWRTVWNSSAEEVDSVVTEERTRREKQASYLRNRRVATGTPVAMILSVVTPIPAGNPTGVERRQARVQAMKLADRRAHERAMRRVGYTPLFPEPVPFINVGMRPRLPWKKLEERDDHNRRAARIRNTSNELGFNYAWLKVGDPCGYILSEIQRHMLEVYSDMGKTWFDPFWTRDEVLDWLETRTNQFLVATGAFREQVIVPATAEIELPNLNDLRRAIYFDGVTGASTPLEIADTHQKDMSVPGWGSAAAGTPDTIIVWGKGITARLSPPPTGGTVLLDYVPRFVVRESEKMRGVWWDQFGPPVLLSNGIDATIWPGFNKTLPIPNIFYPYIKYGVMADMLSKEGEAQDVKRAQYCEQRFNEGVELAKMMLGRK